MTLTALLRLWVSAEGFTFGDRPYWLQAMVEPPSVPFVWVDGVGGKAQNLSLAPSECVTGTQTCHQCFEYLPGRVHCREPRLRASLEAK